MTAVKYSGARPHLLPFIGEVTGSVLDVGCGGGGMGALLRERGARRVVGIEMTADHAEAARATYDEVHCATIESALAEDLLVGERFDMIVLADVLEHLVDPWSALRDLTDRHLAVDGAVFVSIPNVAHQSVVSQLVFRRDWRFEPHGIFDSTHLRWFGRDTAESLLRQAGLEVSHWGGRVKLTAFRRTLLSRTLNDVGRVPRIAVYQFYGLAHRASANTAVCA